MLLTEDVEVFVVRPHQHPDYSDEYVCADATTLCKSSFMAVRDANDYYISIVFGADFNISPSPRSPADGDRVSACRIRVTIDEDIAVQERILKHPDVTKGPVVHSITSFESTSVSSSGKKKRYRAQFAAIPGESSEGIKMPKPLRKSLGHIDVEFERGRLDYAKKPAVFSPVRKPDVFDSTYFVNHMKNECYRTKLINDKSPEPIKPQGVFVAEEAKITLRIFYCADALIKLGASKEKIEARGVSAQMNTAIAALHRTLQASPGKKPTLQSTNRTSDAGNRKVSAVPIASANKDISVADGKALPGRVSTQAQEAVEGQSQAHKTTSKQTRPVTATTPSTSGKRKKVDTSPTTVADAGTKTSKGTKRRKTEEQPDKSRKNGQDKLPVPGIRAQPAAKSLNPPKASKSVKVEISDDDSDSDEAPKQKTVSMIDLTLDSSSDESDDETSGEDEPPSAVNVHSGAKHQPREKPTVVPRKFDWIEAQKDLARIRALSKKPLSSAEKVVARAPTEQARPSQTQQTPKKHSGPSKGDGMTTDQCKAGGEATKPSRHGLDSSNGKHSTERLEFSDGGSAGSEAKGSTKQNALQGRTAGGTLQSSRDSSGSNSNVRSEEDIRLSMAKLNYEILQAEAIGVSDAKAIVQKQIEVQKLQVELASREISRLQAKLPLLEGMDQ